MDARNQFRLDRRGQDASRLRDAEVSTVAKDVAEPGARLVGLIAPFAHLFRVRAHARPAIRGQRVRGEKRDLDPRQVGTLGEAGQKAGCLERALALQVVTRLRLAGGRATPEPVPTPA